MCLVPGLLSREAETTEETTCNARTLYPTQAITCLQTIFAPVNSKRVPSTADTFLHLDSVSINRIPTLLLDDDAVVIASVVAMTPTLLLTSVRGLAGAGRPGNGAVVGSLHAPRVWSVCRPYYPLIQPVEWSSHPRGRVRGCSGTSLECASYGNAKRGLLTIMRPRHCHRKVARRLRARVVSLPVTA